MRQIKFRAWDKIDKYFHPIKDDVDYYFRVDGNGLRLYAKWGECKDTVIMQFTGLKDKNGKEIYEGDICEGHADGIGVITWSDFDGGYDYVFDDDANVGIWEVAKDIRVIGNIYENPELMPNELLDDRSVANPMPNEQEAGPQRNGGSEK